MKRHLLGTGPKRARSVVAEDVPSCASRSTGSWREGVLVPGMGVYVHQWVRPVCGAGIGAG